MPDQRFVDAGMPPAKHLPHAPSRPGGHERVFVGMSGGVDSSLAASLLVEQGYQVTGVYMRNWSRDLGGFRCPWADDLADAERVAVLLGIDFSVWDCEEDYRRNVVDYLVESYRRGLTPNPDVMCNEKIKFGTFARMAFSAGADLIATGHYARTARDGNGQTLLLCSADAHKDQTYFLWRVGANVLSRTVFPIGDIPDKAEVRRMAAERGIEVADKPDSQGICFVGEVGLRPFLLNQIERRPGDVIDWRTGKVLGRHDGAFLFTVGQRRGLDLGGGPARYVVSTDVAANTVTVTDDLACPALWTCSLVLDNVRWVSSNPPAPGRYLVRTRHTGVLREAEVAPEGMGAWGNGRLVVRFDEPVRTVAPGQSSVIYQGNVCLGGGIVSV